MSFLVAVQGTVVYTNTNKSGGAVNIPNWPARGAGFKGSFVYSAGPAPTPALFSKIFMDLGSFTITRKDGIGYIQLVNANAGILYGDGDSPGFNNISLPAGAWQLEEFDMGFANPENHGPAVDTAALDFNVFTERGIYMAGNNGGMPATDAVVWNALMRIDVAIVLPS
jgi:hypothetical protein